MLDISQSCQSSSREEPSGWSADGVSSICANLGKEVEIRPIEAMTNHNTTEVFFDNLEVPPANLIGEEGKGLRYILDGMNAERILVAQECIGDGRWLLQKGINYARERIVFDRPIGQNQGVQFPLARAYAELEAADMICRRAAALFVFLGERNAGEGRVGGVPGIGQHVLGMPRSY